MAAIHGMAERVAGVVTGVCVAAIGGNPIGQSVGGAVVATIGLLAIFREATKKCRIECDHQIGKLADEIKQRLVAEYPAFETEYDDAAQRLADILPLVLPDVAGLASLATSPTGFIEAATNAVMASLRERGAGFDRDARYEQFARTVVATAVELAFTDRDHLPKLEPYLWMEALESLGAIRADTQAMRETLAAHGTGLHEMLSSARRIEFDVGRLAAVVSVPTVIPSAVTPISAELAAKKAIARRASRLHEPEASSLWFDVQLQAESDENAPEEISARLEVALIAIRDDSDVGTALSIVESCHEDSRDFNLGRERCRILQLFGECRRLEGALDRARGSYLRALECARELGSKLDEGFALLGMSALEHSAGKSGSPDKARQRIGAAFDAFTAAGLDADADDTESVQGALADCHSWRAEIADIGHVDEALADFTSALEIYRALGADWNWHICDTLMRRADLHLRANEPQVALIDLTEAAKILDGKAQRGVQSAKLYLQLGELLDYMRHRSNARFAYEQAAAIARTWDDPRKAAYYVFRFACKTAELREFDAATQLFEYLGTAEWLEAEHRMSALSQLCLIAKVEENQDALERHSDRVLALIDELVLTETSPAERRRLLLQKGQHLNALGNVDSALKCFRTAIDRFEVAGDIEGMIEGWSQIRAIMHDRGDGAGAREASETLLALGAERTSPVIAALTLVMLAQDDILEGMYAQARKRIERALELAPQDPVLMIANDLRTRIPP